MGDLRAAFDRSVEANRQRVDQLDDGVIAAGRKIADQIDYAADNMTGAELTKALYLTPHLMNVLKELLATPAARKAAGLSDKEAGGGKLAQLRAVEAGRTAPKSQRRRAAAG